MDSYFIKTENNFMGISIFITKVNSDYRINDSIAMTRSKLNSILIKIICDNPSKQIQIRYDENFSDNEIMAISYHIARQTGIEIRLEKDVKHKKEISLGNKITKPEKCFMGIAIPMTKEDFFMDLEDSSDNFYARSRARKYPYYNKEGLWRNDHARLVDLIERISKDLIKLGVTVKNEFCISDLGMIPDFDVFAIFAHHVSRNGPIELYDGFITCNEFVDKIPLYYSGVIDTTICFSENLLDEIWANRNDCIVVVNGSHASFDFKLKIFEKTIKYLARKKLFYMDAQTRLLRKIKNSL